MLVASFDNRIVNSFFLKKVIIEVAVDPNLLAISPICGDLRSIFEQRTLSNSV